MTSTDHQGADAQCGSCPLVVRVLPAPPRPNHAFRIGPRPAHRSRPGHAFRIGPRPAPPIVPAPALATPSGLVPRLGHAPLRHAAQLRLPSLFPV
ncbi:unnamed protein product [Pipistrellus nathusii]|uniref:Uncharacterized protein n=1 Tax=Pipistrellus nathusii TaxID=59473 RepID=A0ABP0A4W6_PIPNA